MSQKTIANRVRFYVLGYFTIQPEIDNPNMWILPIFTFWFSLVLNTISELLLCVVIPQTISSVEDGSYASSLKVSMEKDVLKQKCEWHVQHIISALYLSLSDSLPHCFPGTTTVPEKPRASRSDVRPLGREGGRHACGSPWPPRLRLQQTLNRCWTRFLRGEWTFHTNKTRGLEAFTQSWRRQPWENEPCFFLFCRCCCCCAERARALDNTYHSNQRGHTHSLWEHYWPISQKEAHKRSTVFQAIWPY